MSDQKLKRVVLRESSTDPLVFYQVFCEECYRPAIGLRDYALIVDCGANIGLSAQYFADRHPNATVLAIEPDEQNFAVLSSNSADYQRIIEAQWAIGGHTGRGKMIGHKKGHWALRVERSPEGRILVVPLRDVLTATSFPFGCDGRLPLRRRPCLLKLDIEGAEVECFQNPDWLELVDVIAVEFHNKEGPEVMAAALAKDPRKHRTWVVGEIHFVEFM